MQTEVAAIVNGSIQPILTQHGVPGMAVAVTVNGQQYFSNFGIASKENGRPVSARTIFEIGSISKVFTATLTAYSASTRKLSLSDPASRHMPELAGTSFDKVSVLELATYTSGGLPLQFPSDVTNHQEMIAFFRNWRPDHSPGTHRLYSNTSIGLAGRLAALSLGQPFTALMEKKLFPLLGLSHSYINVPPDRMGDYAHGYTADGRPVRVQPGVLDAEAYGVKTTSQDLIGFVERTINATQFKDPALRKAIELTRQGYYRIGGMTQGLGWEMYDWPITLSDVLNGNSPDMLFKPNPAQAITPPHPSRDHVLHNKTGSTNGFGAYVAFVPSKRMGVVLLANKSYPIPARVTAAHQILTALEACAAPK